MKIAINNKYKPPTPKGRTVWKYSFDRKSEPTAESHPTGMKSMILRLNIDNNPFNLMNIGGNCTREIFGT
jgi:hypothetical protein